MPDGVVIDDTKPFNDKLAEWENFYNYHCPHGGQTPYERLRQKTQAQLNDQCQLHSTVWGAYSNETPKQDTTADSTLGGRLIEAQFTALRYFALDGTDHASHKERASMIRRYIIWRNNHVYDERLRRIVDRAT
jgi:hypothetical protein